MFFSIIWRPNNHAIANGAVKVKPSEYPFEYNSEYVTDTDTDPIKYIGVNETDQLLEIFHSEHYDYILDVDLH